MHLTLVFGRSVKINSSQFLCLDRRGLIFPLYTESNLVINRVRLRFICNITRLVRTLILFLII
jgi:hypothetical protein